MRMAKVRRGSLVEVGFDESGKAEQVNASGSSRLRCRSGEADGRLDEGRR